MTTDFRVEFFIDETDSDVAKAAEKFRRTQSIEDIREKWSKIRQGIKRVCVFISCLYTAGCTASPLLPGSC
ncbi:unnamed protein product [Gongylonema pulchrum]|uniref:PHM7_ext domain-containing protein n=1 Tax=Gongylonema pulchrum TaxID=637853 RepID=A0A183EZ39_9BILA|nr:unnamed protein product [Gongylonema pulchrum]